MSSQRDKRTQSEPRIEFFRSWCKKCGLCAAFCPKGVLAQDHDGSPYVANADACNACLLCEIRCPDFAIKVTRQSEQPVPPKDQEGRGMRGEAGE